MRLSLYGYECMTKSVTVVASLCEKKHIYAHVMMMTLKAYLKSGLATQLYRLRAIIV